MWLRANIVLAIAVVFAVIQMFASVTGGPRLAETSAFASTPNGGLARSVAAADDNDDEDDEDNDDSDDEDNDDSDSDNSDDEDNSDVEDNDDSDSDNDEDEDNDDSDSDNDEDEDNDDEDDSDNDDVDDDDIGDAVLDNVEPGAAPPAPTATTTAATTTTTTAAPAPAAPASARPAAPASPVASPQPTTEAQLVTTGMDATLTLGTDRVSVQVFASMPAGMTFKVRIVDPLLYPSTPGIRAGDLIFLLEATDATGMTLQTLPGEVNLSVRYTEADVSGLNDTAITLARLDTLDNTWKTAPKLLTDPTTNYLAASVMDAGTYAVYVP